MKIKFSIPFVFTFLLMTTVMMELYEIVLISVQKPNMAMYEGELKKLKEGK